MYLFIFESIGTSELILIGIVALIFLGPRKMPEMARKIGKMMNEFRSTTNEFKETWQREANFEEEAKAFSLPDLDVGPISRKNPAIDLKTLETPPKPEIKEVDAAEFEAAVAARSLPTKNAAEPTRPVDPTVDPLNDKKTWL